ncbi:MAG: Holliday junction resolvase RuvX [Pseudomonadota bacterium]
MSHQYLAFDFGTRYIGVAVGQDVTRTAQPLTTLKRQGRAIDWNAIKKLIAHWKPAAIIVGIPTHDAGPNQWITEAAHVFAEQLAQETTCVVHKIDERLSTIEAREILFAAGGYRCLEKEAVDAMAAKVILETWLRDI